MVLLLSPLMILGISMTFLGSVQHINDRFELGRVERMESGHGDRRS